MPFVQVASYFAACWLFVGELRRYGVSSRAALSGGAALLFANALLTVANNIHPEFPASDGGSLIAALRKNPDKYTYGHDGAGGPGHLGTARILRAMQATARDIPFKGAGDTLTAFLGKHIDIYVGSIPPIREHERSGKAKCVLVTSADRIAALPNGIWRRRSRGGPRRSGAPSRAARSATSAGWPSSC